MNDDVNEKNIDGSKEEMVVSLNAVYYLRWPSQHTLHYAQKQNDITKMRDVLFY